MQSESWQNGFKTASQTKQEHQWVFSLRGRPTLLNKAEPQEKKVYFEKSYSRNGHRAADWSNSFRAAERKGRQDNKPAYRSWKLDEDGRNNIAWSANGQVTGGQLHLQNIRC